VEGLSRARSYVMVCASSSLRCVLDGFGGLVGVVPAGRMRLESDSTLVTGGLGGEWACGSGNAAAEMGFEGGGRLELGGDCLDDDALASEEAVSAPILPGPRP
jgi:hypothetical protein